ncbi:nucleotidyltransferase [Bacillus sp. JJ1764]|uniref:nucleotidyltransferase n=1 Tax=Bacillus sp. JJ1764 TaxID=3122964 RepID=UPI002FFDD018
MKAVGVIVEYNPFHNGHAFHLQASKEAANADVVIAVMSGNFLQRGEPALVSKWVRTQMALVNGVDIVFELPYRFAVQKAEIFATGAVSILDAAGCDSLCFGSESGDLGAFKQTLEFLTSRSAEYDEQIKTFIQTGVSYPKALSLAFQQLSGSEHVLDLSKPNNILGFQYIKAIKQLRSSIEPLTVSRKSANYHDEHFASDTIASATSIRKAIFSNDHEKMGIGQYVPDRTKDLLEEYLERYGTFHHWELYWQLLQFRLLQTNPNELRDIYEMEEGLENRLIQAALEAQNFQEFMQKIKTKRYTWTRLQRLCVHILTNTKKSEMNHLENASYLRLLGMSDLGKEYLNKTKKHFNLPLVSRIPSYKENDIQLDVRAARIYGMCLNEPHKKMMIQQEYKQPPIVIEKSS